jgi:hypothetical protein
VNRFWSYARTWVESEATAVEPWPHNSVLRAAKVAFAIWMAMARAASADRYLRRTYRSSSSVWPWPPDAAALIPVFVPYA